MRRELFDGLGSDLYRIAEVAIVPTMSLEHDLTDVALAIRMAGQIIGLAIPDSVAGLMSGYAVVSS